MSWTQGITLAEDLPESELKLYTSIGHAKFGKNYELRGLVWDITVPDVLYFDYINKEDDTDIKSLKYDGSGK